MASFAPGRLAYKIADVCLKGTLQQEEEKKEEPKKTETSFKVSDALLKLYEGQYQLTPEMILTFKVDNGTLTAQATGQSSFPLTASSETDFTFDPAGIKVTFPKPVDNKIDQFVFNQGGQTLVAPRVKPLDTKVNLGDYIGTYYSPELKTSYTIEQNDKGLVATHIRHEPVVLTPAGEDKFTTDMWFMSSIQFVRDANKKLSELKVSSGRVKNVRFVKQQ
jgi:hypothetical protein